jgi:uncharacterized protein (DUF1697 family)
MKPIIVFVTFIGFHIQCGYAQSIENIELEELKYVIFPESYKTILTIPNANVRFTPNPEEIENALVLLDKYTTDNQIKKKPQKWYIQFAGFYSNDDKVILINLLNKKLLRIGTKNEMDWENEFIIGFGNKYEKYRREYLFNITELRPYVINK